jgi:hypothetical protein
MKCEGRFSYLIFFLCSLRVPPGCSTELSSTGWAFLAQIFEQHDKDRDGALKEDELTSLFAPCPVVPWGPSLRYSVPTNAQVEIGPCSMLRDDGVRLFFRAGQR